jgi:hypothetical protein
MTIQWFLTRDGETVAQYSTEEFKQAVAKGRIRHSDFIRRSDSSTFISAGEFLPASYQAKSGAGAYAAAVVLAIVMASGIVFGLARVLPQHFEQAAINLARLKEAVPDAGSQQTAATPEDVRQTLLADPRNGTFYQALSEKDSVAFEDVVTHVASVATTPLDAGETAAEARRYMMKSVIEPRSRYLSDDDKVAMMTLSKDMSAHLASTNPQMCIAVAVGRPTGDTRPFITDDLASREDSLMIRMLDTAPREIELLPAATLQELNKRVAVKLYEAHADQIALLDLENVPDGQEAAACQMFVAYLEGVLALPREESVALIRAMMTDPARLSGEAPAAEPAGQEAAAADTPAAVPEPSAGSDADTGPSAEPSSSGAPETPFPEGVNSPAR